jgi:acyl-[acyl-carrier-protein]-phospholipid O-acyltransferase/long-chain-fatty-acid--[acyl-carrier-protein] ligase
MSNTFDFRSTHTTLFAALLAAARRHGLDKEILEDADRQPQSYRRLILGSLVIGAKLDELAAPGQAVGVLLPNAAGLVVTLLGLNAYGRVAAMLNFTSGAKNLCSAACTGPLPVVVTSRRFIEAAKLGDVVEALAETQVAPGRAVRIVYLEDVRRSIGMLDKLKGLWRSRFAAGFHRRRAKAPEKPAVILFTSGTEGVPKGVVLTSTNLVANARQIFAHAAGMLSAADTVMNPLPMFHSFGLTAATLMPLLNGMKVVLYPSPLHYKEVPKLIAATKCTVLFGTDTFLQGYARVAAPADLASIRYAIAGAERVKDATRAMWNKTGALILEGYGATECSPVIACNVPDANRPGTVGRLLPGQEVRLEPVEGIARGGRLYVRGPNVMAGYLLSDRPGVLVPPQEGWHDTGDIVSIEDGFVTITGRAKRFAKIGGEMVSLASVESMASGLWPEANHVCVSLPDSKKGETLVLLTDQAGADREALSTYARAQGLPEISVPRQVIVVPAVPVLGTGKLDLPAALELAQRLQAA